MPELQLALQEPWAARLRQTISRLKCCLHLGAGKFFWFVLYNQLSLTFFTFFGECCCQPLLYCCLTCMGWQRVP